MRADPRHERAALITDAARLRECAARLAELTAELPTADAGDASGGAQWDGILAALAQRCLVAAADLETVADAGPAARAATIEP